MTPIGVKAMGFFSKIFSNIGSTVLGSFGTAIGTAGGSFLSSRLTRPNRPLTGTEQGLEARNFYDSAFPGTNPWERLGTGSPTSVAAVAERQQKLQKNIAHREVAARGTIAARQQDVSLRIAKIQGKSAAVAAGGTIGIQNIKPAGDYITGDDSGRSGVTGQSTQRVQAEASRLDSWTRANTLILKKKEVAAEIGRGAGNPATAALQAEAAKMFETGLSKHEISTELNKQYKKLLAAGVAIETINGLSKVMRGFIGRLQIGPRGAGRSLSGAGRLGNLR